MARMPGGYGQIISAEMRPSAFRHGADELTKFGHAVIDLAEHEEHEEFNKLQRQLDSDDLGRIAKAVQAAEAIAPTRPHPGAESAKPHSPSDRSHRCSTELLTRSEQY
jgi:hypothetical protein